MLKRLSTSLFFSSILLTFSINAHAVLIDFEDLSAGTVVTSQYAEVTFSSGSDVVLSQGRPLGQFICGTTSCIEDTILDFTNPVNNLSFWGIQIDSTGKVAEFNIFENGTLTSMIDVFGPGAGNPGGGSRDTFFDLSAYTNITRLEIVNIIDNPQTENGIGWDQFSFDVASVPEPSTILLMATGLIGLGFASRKKQSA